MQPQNPFAPSIPHGAVVQQWLGAMMSLEFVRKIRGRGARGVMSGGWYLDALAVTWANMYYVVIAAPLEPMTSARPLPPVTSTTIAIATAQHDNGVFDASHRSHVLGGEAASWSEHQDSANMDDRIFSRLPAVAERLWTMATQRRYQAIPRYAAILCRLRSIGIRVGPADAMTGHCFT